ncbi:unnamed protein product, partial [Phaeothamnion confervicola]
PASPLRSVCLSQDGRLLLVGTAGHEIIEAPVPATTAAAAASAAGGDRKAVLPPPLVAAPASGRPLGLAATPDGSRYAACGGDDATVRVWDASSHCLVQMAVALPAKAICLTYSADGQFLLTGLDTGKVAVLGKAP